MAMAMAFLLVDVADAIVYGCKARRIAYVSVGFI